MSLPSLVTGIVAHVDAGKTTCIESMLYTSKAIRRQGRVDHQDAFLDYDVQERSRGITIYSKQAGLEWNQIRIDILDTPGHADFSSEMERALSVLDLAVVLISAQDGVQSHTRTIWRCLEHYNVPAVVFVNKMDIAYKDRQELLADLKEHCSDNCIDIQSDDAPEHIAMVSDDLLNQFMDTGSIDPDLFKKAVMNRQCFPVLFGAALKNQGVEALLDLLAGFGGVKQYPDAFGARVFKITTDPQGNRLTHMKITGGFLEARQKLDGEEKADQIRIYSGVNYQLVSRIEAGRICSVKGLENTKAGQGLGFEQDLAEPVLEPCLSYKMILPDSLDAIRMMGYCKVLTMEDPSLQIEYDETSRSIYLRLMGAIQMEILQKRIEQLTGASVGFGNPRIVYRETIAQPVYGYGHFEPLRHYAEVHLLLEPLPLGSGLRFGSQCSRDLLSLNWQRLILSHLAEQEHKGVLTGSNITDMKITLVSGKAHNKHTEGGDFRQATFRALRQGLKKAQNLLLEPYYKLELTVPADSLSKALFDLESRKASVSVTELQDGTFSIAGRGPVRLLMNYQTEVSSYTRGKGILRCELDGYDLCTDQQTIAESIGYDSEADRAHPSGSVFCMQGSGCFIPWDEAEEHMHLPLHYEKETAPVSMNSSRVKEEEARKIFANAGGRNRNEKKKPSVPSRTPKVNLDLEQKSPVSSQKNLPVCLIVDGYNMIYSWSSLKDLASSSLSAAREALISALVNYQGYRNISLIIVFDGYKRADHQESSSRRGSSMIVYTRSNQSADSYIEKKVHDLKGKFRCLVATSDSLIQNSVLASGATRLSARELEAKVQAVNTLAMGHGKTKGTF